MRSLSTALVTLLVLLVSVNALRVTTPPPVGLVSHATVLESYGKLPLNFEANQGQIDAEVQFLARGVGYSLFLTATEAVLGLRQPQTAAEDSQSLLSSPLTERHDEAGGTVLRMQLIGANPQSHVAGQGEVPSKSHYFIGNDPDQWHRDVRSYAKVHYEAVYPGIDLIYYGNQRQLEYDFVVAPGADPNTITLAFEGAETLEVDAQGALVLHIAGGDVRMHKPIIYQKLGSSRQQISGGYLLKGPQEVGFHVASYDAVRPLVIDPVLEYSTYLGGNSLDTGRSIVVDAAGNAYVTGLTMSPNFPRVHALQGGFGADQNVFVAKLNPSGSALVYSTYLGGRGHGDDVDCLSTFARFFHPGSGRIGHTILLANCGGEEGLDIAVDPAGNVYVTGYTQSPDFPTVNPVQATLGGGDCFLRPCTDAFVAKLNSSGSALVYSTYLGGSDRDIGLGVAADAAGNAYVTGGAYSSDFPTVNPMHAALSGTLDGFMAKLNPSGSALVYSTYFGGSSFLGEVRGTFGDAGADIAVDAIGNVYLTGTTASLDFPTVNPLQPTKGGGGPFGADAFVAKLNPSGSAFVYSTYLGGSGGDTANGIAIDAAGHAYVTGQANSGDFPTTVGAFQPVSIGLADAYVAKLNPSGSALLYSTYLGGGDLDQGEGIAVDADGNAYVTGFTVSPNFPTANPVQATLAGFDAAFVTKLNPSDSGLVYSTYLGGSVFNEGYGIAVGADGNAYLTGETLSSDFPTVNPL